MSARRNIVVVMCHGLRSDAVSDSNAWPLTTPGLVKLGQQGLRVVASSACPADWGGMTSLLTGLHARQHGCVEQSETHVRGLPRLAARRRLSRGRRGLRGHDRAVPARVDPGG
jgi:arylsulfatase A-like enzyme